MTQRQVVAEDPAHGPCGSYLFDSAPFAMKYVDRMKEGTK